jgi:hypothetical protein
MILAFHYQWEYISSDNEARIFFESLDQYPFYGDMDLKGHEPPLEVLELPGLWNGSMAGWLTVFVEVPAETFTPVKTIFDLIRKEHRG